MDFKSLISKITEMDDKIESVASPELPKTVKLNEDAELRVLAGTSSILEEAKKMKKDDKKMEEKTEEGLDMNLLKAAQGSMSKNPKDAESDKNVRKKYGYRMDGEPAERDDDPTKQERRGRKRKNEDVEIDTEKFKAKFSKMVEAKKSEKKDDKKKKPMKEAAKPDFLDVDKDGDKKEPMKKASKEADKGDDKKETKGLSAKQKKLPPGLQKAIAKKKTVKESVETKLSFKDMMKLVIESGGQQQIDPVDQALWSWANRVAASKIQESQKAEIFAAMIYERNGGRFEMYDVLSEDQK
jgi:hypothetical protein